MSSLATEGWVQQGLKHNAVFVGLVTAVSSVKDVKPLIRLVAGG